MTDRYRIEPPHYLAGRILHQVAPVQSFDNVRHLGFQIPGSLVVAWIKEDQCTPVACTSNEWAQWVVIAVMMLALGAGLYLMQDMLKVGAGTETNVEGEKY